MAVSRGCGFTETSQQSRLPSTTGSRDTPPVIPFVGKACRRWSSPEAHSTCFTLPVLLLFRRHLDDGRCLKPGCRHGCNDWETVMSVLFGPMIQQGYIVPDMDSALQHWLARGVGPFYLIAPFSLDALHYGTPTV